MSLLQGGPDLVLVRRQAQTVDADGNTVLAPSASAVWVRGRIQPVAADEDNEIGQQTKTKYRFITKEFPAGAGAIVQWQERLWDVTGEPLRSRGSSLTSHVRVLLTARDPEV